MKQILGLILISLLLISCKKNNEEPPPQVPITRDSMLISNVWQIKHIHVLQNSTVYKYERGSQNNTYNYNNDYIEFEKNGAGKYTAGNDIYDITWQFNNSEKTELTYTIYDYANGLPQEGNNLDVKLENVFLSETSFRYAEIYTNLNGANAVCSVYREPKDK